MPGTHHNECDSSALLARSSREKHGDGVLSVDHALELAGGWSTFQWRLLCCLGGCMGFASAHMLCPIFLIPRMMEYWQLSAGESSMQASVFFAGYCVGVILWAGISDRCGRRPATVYAFAVGNVSGIASFFAPTYALFVLFRFACGVGVAGAKNGCFLLATEFAPPAARARVGALISYLWLCGLLYLVASAWLLQHLPWRWLVLSYLPALPVQFILLSLLPESPRFLLVASEPDKARQVILNVFKANGRVPPSPLVLQTAGRKAASSSGAGGSSFSSGSTFGELWRRNVWAKTVTVGTCQGVCTMVFYAITFDPRTNAAAGSLYLGALLGALVELPAYMLLVPMTNRLGRRLAYSIFFVMSAASLFALHLSLASQTSAVGEDVREDGAGGGEKAGHTDHFHVMHTQGHVTGGTVATSAPSANWLAVACALSGRFASVAATNVAYIVAAEAYPTSCRNSAVGWGTGCGRIGAMAAPAIMLSLPSPLIVFTLLCLGCAALVWRLPETAGAALADVAGGTAPGAADGRMSDDDADGRADRDSQSDRE